MYITPNTTIKLYKDVPLDSKYEQSFIFDSKVKQEAYFDSKLFTLSDGTRSIFGANTFQRVDRGVLRIKGNALMYVGVNYLSFKNSRTIGENIYTKIYYCFVDKIEYHNENASTIYYTVDVLQTWQFEWELTDCMIVRQHTETDDIGEHTISEGFEVGDLIVDFKEALYKKDKCVITATKAIDTNNAKWENVGTDQYGFAMWYPFYKEYADNLIVDLENNFMNLKTNLTPNPFYTYCVPLNGEAARSWLIENDPAEMYNGYHAAPIRDYLHEIGASVPTPVSARAILEAYAFRGYSDSLINIQIAPNGLTPSIEQPRDLIEGSSNESINTIEDVYAPLIHNEEYKQRHSIKNNKLLSYPFRQFVMRAGTNNYTYKPELFGGGLIFKAWCVIYPTVEAAIAPLNYGGYNGYANEYTLIRDDFLELATIQNTYNEWHNRNATRIGMGMLSNVVSNAGHIGKSMMSPYISTKATILSAGTSLVGDALSYIGDASYYSKLPDKAVGGLTNGNATRQGITDDDYTFTFEVLRPKAEFIRIYDDFFTRYGYALRVNKKPNLRARPFYTFVQTSGSDIHGEIPADDKAKINSIFDNGITFWCQPNYIGNYTVDNSPMEEANE